MKIFKIMAFLLTANVGIAQNITTAKIDKIAANGLHKIILPTAIRSISQENLADFRILDSKGNQVPYYYKNEQETTSTSNYVEYKIVSSTTISKKQTTIIFENPEKKISSVLLSIANYDGEKTYNLSGSNDQNQWFGLSNNNILSDLNAPEDLNVVKKIEFPLNNYKFLKIELDDKKSLPISVQRVGNGNSKTTNTELLPVDYANKTITEIAAAKKTKIHFLFDNAQFLNQIKFQIAAPKLYKRSARIFKLITQKVKHKFTTIEQEITSFELSAGTTNEFDIYNIYEKDFYIEIENQDNPPLQIAEIKFFQKPILVIADLKSNENYTIKTGNPDEVAPVYDLENFKNSIASALPAAKIIEIVMPKLAAKTNIEKPFYQQSWFMWVCISLGGLAVLYFTASLLKDLNKPNS